MNYLPPGPERRARLASQGRAVAVQDFTPEELAAGELKMAEVMRALRAGEFTPLNPPTA